MVPNQNWNLKPCQHVISACTLALVHEVCGDWLFVFGLAPCRVSTKKCPLSPEIVPEISKHTQVQEIYINTTNSLLHISSPSNSLNSILLSFLTLLQTTLQLTMAPAKLETEDHTRDAAFNKAMHKNSSTAQGGFSAMLKKDKAAQKAAVDEYFKHWDNKAAKDETPEIREVGLLFC